MSEAAKLDTVEAILRGARDLGTGCSEVALAAVHALVKDTSKLRRDYRQRSQDQAPEHNLLRLLRVTRSEVGLHSPFLADLLDPFGSHGQGGIFLRGFFAMLSTLRPNLLDLTLAVTDPVLPWEWIIGRERQRIDISIRNCRIGLLMFIENKIGPHEQPDQLRRYRLLLNRQNGYQCRLLLYLRPRANGPPQSGTPDICLTYEDHIVPWRRTCEQRVGPEHLRANLRQYIEIISNL